jgi:hypothetical protein
VKLNLVIASAVCQLAIRVLAMIAAAALSGSWWVAVPAVIALDLIEGAGRREVERWQRPFRR